MSQNKVKILVACHKPGKVFSNDVYIPIHVGRTVSQYKEEMKDMIGDDTGDNISEKNLFFSELTAQYWAWKNLDSEYIGLCHYRRYFEKEITLKNVDDLLGQKYDMILAPLLGDPMKIGDRLVKSTCSEDTYIFVQCLKKVSPEYYDVAMEVLSGNAESPFNMFVMRKELFDSFATWQFRILFEMEKYVKPSGYSRMKRLYGYMSEMMLTTYARYHKLRVKYLPIVSMLGENSSIVMGYDNRNWIKKMVIKYIVIHGRFTFMDKNAIVSGLKNDGIVIE